MSPSRAPSLLPHWQYRRESALGALSNREPRVGPRAYRGPSSRYSVTTVVSPSRAPATYRPSTGGGTRGIIVDPGPTGTAAMRTVQLERKAEF
jgi:hypothetical protein